MHNHIVIKKDIYVEMYFRQNIQPVIRLLHAQHRFHKYFTYHINL